MPDDQSITRVVAIYGAALATANALWTILRDVRDRGRLRVELDVGYQSGRGIVTHIHPMTARDRCLVTITNIGTRPITPTGIKGEIGTAGQQIFVTPEHLPTELAPGARVFEWINPPSFPLLADVRRLYVTDTTGREWSPPRKRLRDVQRRCAAFLQAVARQEQDAP